MDENKPIDIGQVVEDTELSWTYVKRILETIKRQKYIGFHFEKLGNSWVVWKDRNHIVRKMDNTCGHMLND